ncbi:hypothetical protein FKM82_021390 [Ascaphus truei]
MKQHPKSCPITSSTGFCPSTPLPPVICMGGRSCLLSLSLFLPLSPLPLSLPLSFRSFTPAILPTVCDDITMSLLHHRQADIITQAGGQQETEMQIETH